MSARTDMRLRELFLWDVQRDIPPVVYFHEQSPERLAAEVDEYIVTGGWPEDHPHHRRVPVGIHEQYVRLLRAIASELDKPGGPELPAAWISGLYGSGKSSFAKLLALALDGVVLPDGRSLADALLERDTSPLRAELASAWAAVRDKIEPLAVVFDIGAVARDNEQIHAAAVRQVAKKLGYCSTEPLVAAFELDLERDGQWERFLQVAQQTLGRPWSEVKDRALAEEDFSLVMSVMFPERYTDPMSWFVSRGGTAARADSPEEAVRAIADMLSLRRPGATLFLVIDEVSQYVLAHKDRVDRLRAFLSALGSVLRGKAWLFALGQQQLDELPADSPLVAARDRFPPKLRVHLAATNIRDVVHKRLLQKTPEAEARLRALFEQHRSDLKLYAYGCENLTAEAFIEVYPLLPGYIELLLGITSALRARSSRAQGDDQAIRGLLQLLGELFRSQGLAELPVGALVTLDRIYGVLATALEADVQATLARVLEQCRDDESGLMVRAARAVALLELVQDKLPTEAELVAACLYDRVDRGNQTEAVARALAELRRRNLLGYSERLGYKVQSTASEQWESERRDIGVPRELISELVAEALGALLSELVPCKLAGRAFPWAGRVSDGRKLEVSLLERREDAVLRVDLRYLVSDERAESTWVRRSDEPTLRERLLWVCGDTEPVEQLARELARSRAMVQKYKPRRESLAPPRKLLLQQEEARAEELGPRLRQATEQAWLAGYLYFRGRKIAPEEHGGSFSSVLQSVGSRVLPDLFPHFVATTLTQSELLQLVETELSGPSPKLLGELGILQHEAGRYVASCTGVVPRRVREALEAEPGLSGAALLAHFGSPPYGYAASVVKACVAGLLRAGLVRLLPEGGAEIAAIRDPGVRELFEKDRTFRQAHLFPAGPDDIGFQARARICQLFEKALGHTMDREDNAIADAVSQLFPALASRTRALLSRWQRLPKSPAPPAALQSLQEVLDQAVAHSRQTRQTVQLLKGKLEILREGLPLLLTLEAELTEAALQQVQQAAQVRDQQLAQLTAAGLSPEARAAEQLRAQLDSPAPWRGIEALSPALERLKEAYTAERSRRLDWQEQQVEAARARVCTREAFRALSAEQAHRVLRPLATALTETTAEATTPPLEALKEPFLLALSRAEAEAHERLDETIGDGLVYRLDLKLKHRELKSEAEVEALLAELRTRLVGPVRAGVRIRLV